MGAMVCRPWTEQEDIFLEDSWGHLSVNRIAKKVDRTPYAVVRRAERKKLGGAVYNYNYLTTVDCAELIGVDSTTIIAWIKANQLKAKQQPMIERKVYLITVENFQKFLVNNQDKWKAKNLDEGLFDMNEPWIQAKLKTDALVPKQREPWTTQEEQRVLKLHFEGKTNQQIADITGRTLHGVKRKKERLLKQLKEKEQ